MANELLLKFDLDFLTHGLHTDFTIQKVWKWKIRSCVGVDFSFKEKKIW